MKRKMLILTAILVFAALIVTGCGSKEDENAGDATQTIELKTVETEPAETVSTGTEPAETDSSGTEPAETESTATEETAFDYIITLSTEGSGMYVYTDHEGDQFSGRGGFFEAVNGAVYEIEAVPEEGWKFVNWKKDGSDYSSDAKISVSDTKDTELTAVFTEK